MISAKKSNLLFWMFLSPILIAFTIVVILPFVMGLIYSFTNWSAVPDRPINFIGFENFKLVFQDNSFGNSFYVTTIYTLLSVIIINVTGFLLAIIVTQKFKGNNFLRALFFMPNLIGGLILGFMWKFVFLKIFPAISIFFGLAPFNWLANPHMALFAMVVVSTWQMSGYIMIIYIAAIQSIPDSLIEASCIDGAHFGQRLRHIVFPLVAQAFTISLFLTLSNSFKMFDINLALTSGGPNRSTELLTFNIYTTAFSKLQFGFGQAKAILFFFVITIITIIQVTVTKKREVEM